ncbi:FAD-dependent oxidoreductase [Rhodopirellula sp. SWK7]|uniref:FAD-dependent oxidoreductase n=1 Tax=Rhodopirellula sp. SWK7 TaxID=595460 RepID=UPI0002BEBCEF|nr:FAD-dependent oxidoreductase [Rhodopirellula sp. SWK7]EMI46956.1 Lipase, GDSL domain protein [Rhodopirellula sp. SWK7]
MLCSLDARLVLGRFLWIRYLAVLVFGLGLSMQFQIGLAVGAERSEETVVCFGDSITRRGFPEILGRLLGVKAINAGVAGHTSQEGLRRMNRDVLEKNPDVVVIFFGTNDIRVDSKKHVPVSDYAANLRTMIEKCRSHDSRVVICTLPPIDHAAYFKRHEKATFDQVGGLVKLMADYRATAMEVARDAKVPVVDLYSLLPLEPIWMSPDGVHPREQGSAIIAKHVASAVRPLLLSHGRKPQHDEDSPHADVVVYGGTSAGVIASVQIARMNRSVVLLEPGKYIGGMTSGGLGATDIGNKDVIGGLSREFYRRVAEHYADDSAWIHETREEFFSLRSKRTTLQEVSGPGATMWTFEPHVADEIFGELLRESGVEVRREQRIESVTTEATRIVSLQTDADQKYHAKMFIDATYEGDLMAKAGVSYRVGREANSEYDETLNGIRDRTPKNQIYDSVDPYVVPGDRSSGLIPLVQTGDGGTPGEGDHRVQAYNFRLCFTNVAANRRELLPPDDYDPERYELAARRVERIVAKGMEPKMKNFCNPVWMPNFKTDINNSQGISTDFIGANYEYPDADHATRAEIWQAHENYVRGFWYFMSTSPRVPESLRSQFRAFGPCRDEFLDTQGFSNQLYVREARRMKSDYVMTEHNCRGNVVANDSVGMAAYGMDSHNCQRIVQGGAARNEGDVQEHGLRPYPISYRSIVPKAEECENLLVPVCVSATHIAFGSIRMEPVFMVLGQSAAVAAVSAIDADTTVQQVGYSDLRELLWASGQVLTRRSDTEKHASQTPAFRDVEWNNRDGDNDWNNQRNWSVNALPSSQDSAFINLTGDNKVKYGQGVSPNLNAIYVGSKFGRGGELEITGGKLEATSRSTRHTRVGLSGGHGTVEQSGGDVTLNSLQIGLDAQSKGIFRLSGGKLRLKRSVKPTLGSLDIGNTNYEGSAEFVISGGGLETQSGVTLGYADGEGRFTVDGSDATLIEIGSHDRGAGFWNQNSISTLKIMVDQRGVGSIKVNAYRGEGGDVTFEKNAFLEPSFHGGIRSGSWDVMSWEGTLVDRGLRLASGVDSDVWEFKFVDTDASGTEDTLRITARVKHTQPEDSVARLIAD